MKQNIFKLIADLRFAIFILLVIAALSIIEAMYHAFYEKREFTTEDICLALTQLIPLSQLENDQTLKLKNWALSGRIRLASSKIIPMN